MSTKPNPTSDIDAEATADVTPSTINERGTLASMMRDEIVAEARKATINARGSGIIDPFDLEWAEAVIGQRITQGKLSASRRWIHADATAANVKAGIRSIVFRDITDDLWPTIHAALKAAAVNKGLTVGRGSGQITFTYVSFHDRDGNPKTTAAAATLGTYRMVVSK